MSMTTIRKYCRTYSLFWFGLAECITFSHLDWSIQLWLLITEPHHPNDGHGDAEPVEEAEEVYDREDVVGEGVEQRHQALEGVR